MYCAQCGTANVAGSDACEVCGSPLAPSAGNLTCYACGASVSELDRYCYTCGNSLTGPTGRRYDPDPSFIDDEPIEVDVAELPVWLRQLAASSPHADFVTPARTATMDAGPEDALPDWLREPRPAAEAPTAGVAVGGEAAPRPVSDEHRPPNGADQWDRDAFSFLTEDDLPEWLRALGDTTPEEPTPPEPERPALATSAPATRFSREVPSVSRAWLSRSRRVDPDRDEQARSSFMPVRTVAQHDQAADVPEPGATPTAPPVEADPAPGGAAEAAPVDSAGGARRRRLLLLAIVAAVVLLLVIFVAQNAL